MLEHIETGLKVCHVLTHCFHVLGLLKSVLLQNMNAVPQTAAICHLTNRGYWLIFTDAEHLAELIVRLNADKI